MTRTAVVEAPLRDSADDAGFRRLRASRAARKRVRELALAAEPVDPELLRKVLM